MHFLAGGAFGLLCAVFCAFVIPQWITPADDSPTLLVSEAARVKVVVASIMQPTAEYRGEPNAPLRWSRVRG